MAGPEAQLKAAELVDVDVLKDRDDALSAEKSGRRPELLHHSEVATLAFRFAVGEIVRCSIAGGFQEGEVLQRCYREEEWPDGYYAAYQVRLHAHRETDGSSLIYAPRDDDSYIRPATSPSQLTISRRLSGERRLIQKLEISLRDSRADGRKQAMYETLRKRHKQAMQRIIDDVTRCAVSQSVRPDVAVAAS